MNRLERLYAISEEIRRRSPTTVSATLLAERFGVSRRTMERDLAALRNAGVPLYSSPGRSGGQAILGTGAGRHMVSLSAEEITGLLMAVTASAPMPFGDAATAGARRVLASLPEETQVVVDQLRDKIRVAVPGSGGATIGAPTNVIACCSPREEANQTNRGRNYSRCPSAANSDGGRERVDPGPGSASHRIRRVLEQAVRLGKVVNIDYVDQDGVSSVRPVESVGFYRGDSRWFLIGWCRLRGDRRLFRLDRIQVANLTSERFAPRDVEETLGWVPGPAILPEG